jgi:hypothetical protein
MTGVPVLASLFVVGLGDPRTLTFFAAAPLVQASPRVKVRVVRPDNVERMTDGERGLERRAKTGIEIGDQGVAARDEDVLPTRGFVNRVVSFDGRGTDTKGTTSAPESGAAVPARQSL